MIDVPVLGSVDDSCALPSGNSWHWVEARDMNGKPRSHLNGASLMTWTEQKRLTSLIEKQMLGIVPMVMLDCPLADSMNITCSCFIGVPSLSHISLRMIMT